MFRRYIAAIFLLNAHFASAESITGSDVPYLSICVQAVANPYFFQNFRSMTEYTHALEITNGAPFAAYLLDKASLEIQTKFNRFKKLESFGNPRTTYYPSIGNFSATTLRYMAIADEITKRFTLPENAKIVEIGGGFGGQSYILSQAHPCSKYYIYDLPEVNALIEKMMGRLGQTSTVCLGPDAPLPETRVDLFISNYAFSECDRDTQIDYIEQVLKKADRGYLIYNQISEYHDLTSLSPFEFVALLEKHGLHPRVYQETIPTFDTNVLIIWDLTKEK